MWPRHVLIAVALALMSPASTGMRAETPSLKIEALPEDIPDDCSRLAAPGASPAAAVLRPLNGSVLRQPNVTLLACVKNTHQPHVSAWLHVVSADSGYDRTSSSANPILLEPGSTAIAWTDVPAGQHAAFVEIRTSLPTFPDPHSSIAEATARSLPSIFTVSRERPHASPRHYRAQDASSESRPRRNGPAEHNQATGDWPLLHHLRSLSQRGLTGTGNINTQQAQTRAAEPPQSRERRHESRTPRWCGVSDWETVSLHEVVAAFLQSEWYKDEHREFRGTEPFESLVLSPNTTSTHENVLRAMLMATPRKINMLRSLPLDTRARKVSPHVLARMHLMCEKTWGEEFRDALALASGSSALDECAALNVSRVVELAQQCLPHCPPIDGHKEPGDRPLDATDMHADMVPALEGEHPLCGRHCYKMHSILESARAGNMGASRTTIVVMAEDDAAGAGAWSSPCVLLEGNHRAAPLLLLSEGLQEQESGRRLTGLASGGIRTEVDVLLGASSEMRKSTYFLGVAAGIDRQRGAEKIKNQ